MAKIYSSDFETFSGDISSLRVYDDERDLPSPMVCVAHLPAGVHWIGPCHGCDSGTLVIELGSDSKAGPVSHDGHDAGYMVERTNSTVRLTKT